MIYPQSFEQKIGFDRLREQIVMLCNTQAGRAIIEAESFSTSRSDIERRQDIADEMRTLLMLDPDAPRDEFPDMEAVMATATVTATEARKSDKKGTVAKHDVSQQSPGLSF